MTDPLPLVSNPRNATQRLEHHPFEPSCVQQPDPVSSALSDPPFRGAAVAVNGWRELSTNRGVGATRQRAPAEGRIC